MKYKDMTSEQKQTLTKNVKIWRLQRKELREKRVDMFIPEDLVPEIRRIIKAHKEANAQQKDIQI